MSVWRENWKESLKANHKMSFNTQSEYCKGMVDLLNCVIEYKDGRISFDSTIEFLNGGKAL